MSTDAVPADRSLDTPHADLVALSARFAHAFLRWLDTSTSDGLTYHRLRLLEELHCRGPAKMVTLADGLGLSARNVTALADSLETDGLVRRVAHPTDRRATLLELTAPGVAAADESLAPRLAAMGRLFDEISPGARSCLTDAMTTLVAALEPPTAPASGRTLT